VRIRRVDGGTASDGFHWSGVIESHCETTKFSPCPTVGQVVAGSNPVSPTREVGSDLLRFRNSASVFMYRLGPLWDQTPLPGEYR
jgi:hypothetical protein